jgi:hypothetical protein
MIDDIPEVSDLDATPDAPTDPFGIGTPVDRDEPRPFSVLGLLLALVGAAGMAMAITLLYNGMATVMQTQGGFVATGGPYVIAHPAPTWVGLVPLSIFAIFLFGAVGIYASNHGWGVNPVAFAWAGLFISLGWNFLRLGFFPPEGLQGAWAWIACGVVFWIMGFAPLLFMVRQARSAIRGLIERQNSGDARKAWRLPEQGDTTAAYIGAQLAGVAGGIAAGVAVFSWVAG